MGMSVKFFLKKPLIQISIIMIFAIVNTKLNFASDVIEIKDEKCEEMANDLKLWFSYLNQIPNITLLKQSVDYESFVNGAAVLSEKNEQIIGSSEKTILSELLLMKTAYTHLRVKKVMQQWCFIDKNKSVEIVAKVMKKNGDNVFVIYPLNLVEGMWRVSFNQFPHYSQIMKMSAEEIVEGK
jgi:hypothetical protein